MSIRAYAVIALCVATLVEAPRVALAQAAPDQAIPALASALARQRDAESLANLSVEGRLLYSRERVKLDGYQYCSQAVSLAERGEFRQSIRAASKALHLGQRASDSDLIGTSMRDLSIAYSYAGNLDRAEEYAQSAIAQNTKDPRLVAAPANKVLGDVALRRGRVADAIARYNAALAVASSKFRPLVELSLANAYVAARDPARARAIYDGFREPEDDALRQSYLRGLGELLLAEGRPADAAREYGRLLAGAKGLDAQYQRLWAHEGLGRSYIASGDSARAGVEYAAAVNAADSIRARFRSEEFKAALFGDVQQVFDRALALSMASGEFATAFAVSEKSRARALLDLIRERVGASVERASASAASALDASGARAALRDDEVLVEYHTVEDRSFAWVLRRDSIAGFEIPAGRKDLTARITRFRDSIIERRRDTAEQAAALHALLVAPLKLQPGERLVIVPHGPLHYLAFQALRDGNAWMIERHAIAIAPSATIAFGELQRGPASKGPLIAFGNPANEAKYALPGSQREVERIGAIFPDSRVFVQEDASRSRFREFAARGRVLHVAAHAEVDEVDPLFSRILLAREGNDPGFIEAREIFGLELSGVSLVTLSACESGLGSSEKGDELLGFNRSFLTAGAASLVSSLWPVDDDSTEFLMIRMYAELARGTDLHRAIQAAQVQAMRRPRYEHPFFWAPFIVMGDWRQGVTQ